MALAGFIFTSRPWLQFLNGLGPETGLVAKHLAILFVIFVINYVDPSIKLTHTFQAIGVLFVYMSFLLIFDYQSQWIQDAGTEHVGDQTVDGVVYHRVHNTFGLEPDTARIVAFVLVPFVLIFLGSRFIRNGQKINLD